MAIYLITAPSGAGKTTLVKALEKGGFWKECISTTTRPMRKGEVDGETYYFTEESDFADADQMGEFAELVTYDGNYYGITHKEIERVSNKAKNVAIIVEHGGYKQLKESYPDAIGIFLYMSKEDCLANMLIRGDNYESALKRIEKYDNEMKTRFDYDYVIKNVRNKQSSLNIMVINLVAQNS